MLPSPALPSSTSRSVATSTFESSLSEHRLGRETFDTNEEAKVKYTAGPAQVVAAARTSFSYTIGRKTLKRSWLTSTSAIPPSPAPGPEISWEIPSKSASSPGSRRVYPFHIKLSGDIYHCLFLDGSRIGQQRQNAVLLQISIGKGKRQDLMTESI